MSITRDDLPEQLSELTFLPEIPTRWHETLRAKIRGWRDVGDHPLYGFNAPLSWDGIDRPVVGHLLYVTEGGRYHHEHNRPRYDQRLILVEQVVSLTRQPTTHSHWGTA